MPPPAATNLSAGAPKHALRLSKGLASETWVNWRPKLDASIAPLRTAQNPAALAIARELRAAGLTVKVGDGALKLSKSFDTGDTPARHVTLLGEDEATTSVLTPKLSPPANKPRSQEFS